LPLAQVRRVLVAGLGDVLAVGRPTGGVLEGQHTGEPHERDRPVDPAHQVGFDR
jgi:hypothetical protein